MKIDYNRLAFAFIFLVLSLLDGYMFVQTGIIVFLVAQLALVAASFIMVYKSMGNHDD